MTSSDMFYPELECCEHNVLEKDLVAPPHIQRCFNIPFKKEDPEFKGYGPSGPSVPNGSNTCFPFTR